MKQVPFFLMELRTNRYSYLWLKYVRSANLNVHCTRCLVGHFSKIIPFRKNSIGAVMEGYMNEVTYDCVYYLCGVTNIWEDNLHIAFKYEKGSEVKYESKLVKVRINDAVQLPIEPIKDKIDKGPEFLSCRNYQWAWNYFGLDHFGKQTTLEL